MGAAARQRARVEAGSQSAERRAASRHASRHTPTARRPAHTMSGISRRDSSEAPSVCGADSCHSGAIPLLARQTHSDGPERNVAVQVLEIEGTGAPALLWVQLHGGQAVCDGGVAACEEEMDKVGGTGDGGEPREHAEAGADARGGWACCGGLARVVEGSGEDHTVEEEEEALARRGRGWGAAAAVDEVETEQGHCRRGL